MNPEPEIIRKGYKGSDKLKGKAALITGGDSGIGRAVAVHFAREGADVAIVYLNENEDAKKTKKLVEEEGRKCLLLPGNVQDVKFCKQAVEKTKKEFGRLDILVNNAAEQHVKDELTEISPEQLEETFRTNIFAQFYLAQEAVKYLPKGGTIINTASITAYRGSEYLLDYSATKGAIVSFTRSLSINLAPKGIRVNAVAPGPIWTPLIPATFDEKKVQTFGQNTALKRAGQPSEVAPAYVYLASEDSSFVVGEIIHINGGDFVGG